eukprot:CAMPEP_0168722728 /NCGR_PEP_ID=MMETSP0724-20121128/2746_1 /TAXON_ID=265536 /ORGANISM="Amphiprora sp., Strain CCMP467" /LENGTH=383 /DNA_ID=CAMNT_0008769407 /DNA_START=164 /DNA_END=1312 /DNA_ORIENTATION=+
MIVYGWGHRYPHPNEDDDQEQNFDPTNPKHAVRRNLAEFITVGGVIYRPGMHYNCTKTNGQNITLPRLPTFLIVGTQKGGTSALNALLGKHRRILEPAYFEPHFFDQHPAVSGRKKIEKIHELTGQEHYVLSDEEIASKKRGEMPTYRTPPVICDVREVYSSTCFYKGKVMQYPAMLSYEKTPAYILTQGAPQTIQTIAPWAKIIISLRNPVDRAFSNYKMLVSRNAKIANTTFEEFLAQDLAVLRWKNFSVPGNEPFPKVDLQPDRLKNPRWMYSNYIYRSLYADQLRPWLERYSLGKDLLVVGYERLNENPDIVLREILEFLQIPDHNFRYKEMVQSYSPTYWKDSIKSEAATKLTLRAETREYLRRLFKAYNQQLALMLG